MSPRLLFPGWMGRLLGGTGSAIIVGRGTGFVLMPAFLVGGRVGIVLVATVVVGGCPSAMLVTGAALGRRQGLHADAMAIDQLAAVPGSAQQQA